MPGVKYVQRMLCTHDGIVQISTYRLREEDLLRLPKFDHLDLADCTGTLPERYQKVLFTAVIEPRMINRSTAAYGRRHAADDCSVLFEKVGHEKLGPSLLNLLSQMMDRSEMDWIGRNIFLQFILMTDRADFLKSGEGALKFMNLALRLGYEGWKSNITDQFPWRMSDMAMAFAYPSIIKGFYKIKSEHPLLLKEFLDMFCLSLQTERLVFDMCPDVEHLEFLLDVANKTKFDFWGARDALNGVLSHIVCNFIDIKRYGMVSSLIKYGFSIEKMENPISCPSSPYCTGATPSRREATQSFLWNIGMSHIVGTNLTTTPEFSEMHRKLVLSLPYPREPVREVLGRFQRTRISDSNVSRESAIEAYLTSSMHPEDRAEGDLVRLSHLCRCVLRERLRKNYQLPQGVYALDAPTRVKEFINIEDTEPWQKEESFS